MLSEPHEGANVLHRASLSKQALWLSYAVGHHNGREHGIWNQEVLGPNPCPGTYMGGDFPEGSQPCSLAVFSSVQWEHGHLPAGRQKGHHFVKHLADRLVCIK